MSATGVSSSHHHPEVQEEGVLRDVLDELDKERRQRAELQAKIRALEAHQQEALQQNKVLSLQYEVEGFKQVINELTASKPALTMTNRQCTIASHLLRLLEIIPWDARAHEFIFQQDTLYEWQIHVDDQWQTQLKHFPAALRNLSIIKSMTTTTSTPSKTSTSSFIPTLSNPVSSLSTTSSALSDTDPNNILAVLAGASAVTGKQRYLPLANVMTDTAVSKIFHTPDQDYPLPPVHGAGGTWEWVDVWHPEPSIHNGNGVWAYGSTIQQAVTALHDTSSASESARPPSPSTLLPKQLLRCRAWTRQRVLVSYPNICDSTRAYLRQLASSAQHAATSRQLIAQLDNTHNALSQSQDDLKMTRAQLVEARRLLQNVVMNRTESPSDQQQEQSQHDTELIIEFLAQSKLATGTFASEAGNGDAATVIAAPAVVDHGSNALADLSSLQSTPNKTNGHDEPGKSSGHNRFSSSSSTGSGDMFDWKRLGRGALMDRIKMTQQQQQHP